MPGQRGNLGVMAVPYRIRAPEFKKIKTRVPFVEMGPETAMQAPGPPPKSMMSGTGVIAEASQILKATQGRGLNPAGGGVRGTRTRKPLPPLIRGRGRAVSSTLPAAKLKSQILRQIGRTRNRQMTQSAAKILTKLSRKQLARLFKK